MKVFYNAQISKLKKQTFIEQDERWVSLYTTDVDIQMYLSDYVLLFTSALCRAE